MWICQGYRLRLYLYMYMHTHVCVYIASGTGFSVLTCQVGTNVVITWGELLEGKKHNG